MVDGRSPFTRVLCRFLGGFSLFSFSDTSKKEIIYCVAHKNRFHYCCVVSFENQRIHSHCRNVRKIFMYVCMYGGVCDFVAYTFVTRTFTCAKYHCIFSTINGSSLRWCSIGVFSYRYLGTFWDENEYRLILETVLNVLQGLEHHPINATMFTPRLFYYCFDCVRKARFG